MLKAVDNVSFTMEKGETIGIIGESGCGKTTLVLSFMKLLPPAGLISGGTISFKDHDITRKTEKEMENIRGKEISMVFQGALSYLNPIRTAGQQIVESILTHNKEKISVSDARLKTEKLLGLVGMSPSKTKSYPHELSGGMKQRVMIAIALACNPDLILFDEPMTALDVIVQSQIINLMKDLKKQLSLSVILVTHNWNIISELSDKCIVMYAGKIIEYTDTITLYNHPIHPYTKALLDSIPSIKESKTFSFQSISGSPPNLLYLPEGCSFYPRCLYATDICHEKNPELIEVSTGRFVACHRGDNVE